MTAMPSSWASLARQLRKEQDLANGRILKRNVHRPSIRPLPVKQEARILTLLLTAYTFHAYGRTEGVAGIIISDPDYPALVAHQLLSKVVDEFLTQYPRSAFANSTPTLEFKQLKEYIVKYQDPQQADSIMKIQKELDETKIVLHKTIESVLERGEKIDDLVQKSDGLSAQSKVCFRLLAVSSLATYTTPPKAYADGLVDVLHASEEAEFVLCFNVVVTVFIGNNLCYSS